MYNSIIIVVSYIQHFYLCKFTYGFTQILLWYFYLWKNISCFLETILRKSDQAIKIERSDEPSGRKLSSGNDSR